MKKPVEAIERLRTFLPLSLQVAEVDAEILAFLDSLPDSFEIVPEGHVCVKRPEGLDAGALRCAASHLEQCPKCAGVHNSIHYLRALAAIAPVEKKRRKVTLWQHETDGLQRWTEHEGTDYAIWLKYGWRKVGECEVTT